MLVDGANGGVTDPAHGGWFDVVDFSMAAARGVLGNSGSGAQATGPELATITVALADSHALTVLLAGMASGTRLGGGVIEGTSNLGVEKAVYDLSLGDVFISGIQANSSGGFNVEFTAGQFQVDTVPYDGKIHNISAWNAIKQDNSFDPIAPAPGATANDDVLTYRDTAEFISGISGNDIVYAMGGGDTIFAYDGNTKVFAGAGKDTVLNIGGNNTFDGGDGNDLLSYTNADSGVTVNLNNLLAQNTAGSGIDTIRNFENLDRSDFNDVLTGNTLANIIHGLGGNNLINGLAGNDTIAGGIGNDTMNGGQGSNVLTYEDSFAAVTVNLGLTKAQNTVGEGIDTTSSCLSTTPSASRAQASAAWRQAP